MVKTSVPPSACMVTDDGVTYCIDPVHDTLRVLVKRWALLVVVVLGEVRGLRFNEVKRAVPGITSRGLSDVLRELVGEGLVVRQVEDGQGAPSVRYRLSREGKGLRKALLPLVRWAGERV